MLEDVKLCSKCLFRDWNLDGCGLIPVGSLPESRKACEGRYWMDRDVEEGAEKAWTDTTKTLLADNPELVEKITVAHLLRERYARRRLADAEVQIGRTERVLREIREALYARV